MPFESLFYEETEENKDIMPCVFLDNHGHICLMPLQKKSFVEKVKQKFCEHKYNSVTPLIKLGKNRSAYICKCEKCNKATTFHFNNFNEVNA